jgi:hypothetical protein
VLVTAVLGPEQREDGELEIVRLPTEEFADSRVLAVGEPEGSMERLFRYRRQSLECSGGRRRGADTFEPL